jgi:hypothetical protein
MSTRSRKKAALTVALSVVVFGADLAVHLRRFLV